METTCLEISLSPCLGSRGNSVSSHRPHTGIRLARRRFTNTIWFHFYHSFTCVFLLCLGTLCPLLYLANFSSLKTLPIHHLFQKASPDTPKPGAGPSSHAPGTTLLVSAVTLNHCLSRQAAHPSELPMILAPWREELHLLSVYFNA